MNAKLMTALCGLIVSSALATSPVGAAEASGQASVSPGGNESGRVVMQGGPPPGGIGIPFLSLGGRQPASAGHAVVVPFGPYIGAEGVFGDGIGWSENYYGASIFQPYHIDPGRSLIFTTNKFWGTEGGNFVSNSGLGYRQYVPGMDRVFGISGWFDTDHEHADPFYRAGVSLESLGRWWEMRANGYIILGSEDAKADSFLIGNARFQGNQIVVSRATYIDQAYSGADFEVGGPAPFLGQYGVSSYLGGYFLLADDDDDTAGVTVRVESQFTDDATVGVQYAYDREFGASAYASVSYTFPDGVPTRWFRQRPVKEKLAVPVVREDRIAVHRRTELSNEALINPDTGNAFFISFIDPDATGAGSGTFEDPFGSVAAFTNNAGIDIIFVEPGNTANLDGGFALFDNQRLLSSSVQHFAGGFPLPFTPGPLPELTNTSGGPVITLANNNEVSGFIINGQQPAAANIVGIDGTNGGAGITSFNINNNEFRNTLDSVVITSVGASTGVFSNNTLLGDGTDSNRGFSVTANPGSTLDLVVASNSAQDYLGDYEDLNGNGVLDAGEDTNNNGVLDTGTAFEITADNSTINALITNNTALNNGTGLALNSVNGGDVDAVLEGNNFSNNVAVNTGLRLTAAGASTLNFDLLNNTVSGNNGNGIGVFALSEDLNGNGVLDAGEDLNSDGLIDGSTVTAGVISGNIVNNNLQSGMLFDSHQSTLTIDSLVDNIIGRQTNGEEGIFIDATDSNVTFASVLRNRIIGGGVGSSFGIGANINGTTAPGSANLVLNVGNTNSGDFNLLDRNGDAGIGVNLQNFASATVTVQNNLIGNTTNGGALNFSGEGVRFRLDQNAELNAASLITNNLIEDNTSSAISAEARSAARINGLTITNNDLVSNSGDGINFLRQGSAVIGTAANQILIQGNLIDGNSDGLDLTSQNTSQFDYYTIRSNAITNNTNRGVHLRAEADAGLNATMVSNFIDSNLGDGIEVSSEANSALDDRRVNGTWQQNQITNNGGHGINVTGTTTGGFVGGMAEGILVGHETNSLLGNLISANGGDGVQITGAGHLVFGNNIISLNGTGGVDLFDPATFNNVRLVRNQIVQNTGDGLEITNNSGLTTVTVDAELNLISGNTGRGVDILNQGHLAATDVTLQSNTISGNDEEGVYLVNTADGNQSRTGTTLTDGGATTNDSRLIFRMDGNTVDGNGSNSDLSATGLVMRIGTMDANPPNDDAWVPGTFATNGSFGDGLSFSDFVSGGVMASVTNNTLFGNFGDDILIESFVSTAPPTPTAGTWNQTTFDNTAHQNDPLARLDLHFFNNNVDSQELTKEGAYYASAEGDWKSRNFKTAPNISGPWSSASRRRNAQRLAARFNLGPSGPTAGADSFLYPGIGQSTFRITQTSDTGLFALDNLVYDDIGDANGDVYPGGGVDQVPWGWGLIP